MLEDAERTCQQAVGCPCRLRPDGTCRVSQTLLVELDYSQERNAERFASDFAGNNDHHIRMST